jgi:hypothetical protein
MTPSVLRAAVGEAMGMYHRENAHEGFLVLSGECLLIVEERTPVRITKRLRACLGQAWPAGVLRGGRCFLGCRCELGGLPLHGWRGGLAAVLRDLRRDIRQLSGRRELGC